MGGVLCVSLAMGCAASHYSKKADKEVYQIIKTKSKDVPNMEEDFSLGKDAAWTPLDGLPAVTSPDPALGADADSEMGAAIISLEHALEIAVKNSRTYQNQKESLYLEALGLTLDRHRYTPIFSAKANTGYKHATRDVSVDSDLTKALDKAGPILDDLETLTGTPGTLLKEYATVVEEAGNLTGATDPHVKTRNDESVSAGTSLNVNLLLKGGGKIALGLTSSFLRYITGDSRVATSTVLKASYSQPLWQGRGARVSAETLTQSERDVLYALREFTRFRKDFSVDVCSAYYQVLKNRDAVRNNWQSLENFRKSVEREKAFAKEGRRTQAALGRLEQSLFNSETSWISSVLSYRESLDEFKIRLGLSTDAKVVLDDKELETLRTQGLIHPSISQEDAIKVALAARLDYFNEKDRLEDSHRKLAVAEDNLKPSLDAVLSTSVPSKGTDGFQNPDFRRTQFEAGLDFDPALDKKSDRNTYRTALITYERNKRSFSLAEDNIKLQVRAEWRSLEQARRNYEIARKSVELSSRRVEEQQLLAQIGRATALDQVDTQNDLTRTRNDLTSALVTHTIARLTFWRDMGILYIKKNGQWEEVTDAVKR